MAGDDDGVIRITVDKTEGIDLSGRTAALKYYAEALACATDEFERWELPEHLELRRPRLVAVMRMASHWMRADG